MWVNGAQDIFLGLRTGIKDSVPPDFGMERHERVCCD